ncbi:MAG: hypothetical protein QGG88_09340 [Gammaproteobacteria bacterium]|jgi:hypothetical protein|nr:hypothetical protein [Gammaproteobacteria bacterium]
MTTRLVSNWYKTPPWLFSLCLILAAVITASILFLEPLLRQIPLLPDAGAAWYYWQLPEPTWLTRASAWGGYLLHQLFIWSVIVWAQRHRNALADRHRLHAINYIALGGTLAFVALHYLQTALFYDGLAQDVSVFSSQASVVMLLVVVLIIETPRRGLIMGRGKSRFTNIRPILIRYHGYYFAWAITYTFWFHPMETTFGHLLGFFYTFMLFIQAGFIFTRVHTNRYWTLLLEVGVLVHGVSVALIAGQEFWPMFAFGFALIFMLTQMYGIDLNRFWRISLWLLFLLLLGLVYSQRGWQYSSEILRIPVIDYVLVFILAAMINLFSKRRLKPS